METSELNLIQENNKLIAEFMELDILYGTHVHHESAKVNGWVTSMKYHCSSDWLMPVALKLSSLGRWKLSHTLEYFFRSDNSLYEAVVDLIKLHNEEQKLNQ